MLACFKQFMDVHFAASGKNTDRTVSIPTREGEDFIDTATGRSQDHDGPIRSAVVHALAMRSVAIRKEQIRSVLSKNSGERSIKISNVDRGMRTRLKVALRKAGVPTISRHHVGAATSDWAIYLAASEVDKLLVGEKNDSDH